MASQLRVVMDGDEYKLFQSLQKVIGGVKETDKAFDDTRRTSTEAEQAAQRMARAQARSAQEGARLADSLARKNETLLGKYERQKRLIKEAAQAGKISNSEAVRGLDNLQEELDDLSQKYDVAETKVKDLGKANNNTFGEGAQSKVVGFAKSFAGVLASIKIVTEAIQFFNREKEAALGETDTLADARRSLRQVSRGDFDQLEARSDDLTRFGIDRTAARQLVFAARSTGFEGEEATVAAANPVINIEDGAAFAGEFRKFFAGDNLSIEQAFNTALAGAAESQFNITQLLPQIRKAAQGQLAGGESSDVVAAASVLASNFGESTGDRLRALGVKLATNEQTQGLNMIDAVRKLAFDDKLRQEIVKDSSELKAVVSKFIERGGEIIAADKRIEAEQRRTGRRGLIGQAIAEALDPTTRSGQVELSRIARVAAEQNNLRAKELELSGSAGRARAAAADAETRQLERGDSIFARTGGALAREAVSRVGASPRTVGVASEAGAAAGDATGFLNFSPFLSLSKRANELQEQLIRKQEEGNRRLKEISDKTSQVIPVE